VTKAMTDQEFEKRSREIDDLLFADPADGHTKEAAAKFLALIEAAGEKIREMPKEAAVKFLRRMKAARTDPEFEKQREIDDLLFADLTDGLTHEAAVKFLTGIEAASEKIREMHDAMRGAPADKSALPPSPAAVAVLRTFCEAYARHLQHSCNRTGDSAALTARRMFQEGLAQWNR
jgi:hypothetical protein